MALKLAFNPLTAQFDLVQNLSGLPTTYAKLDGTNQPFTGNIQTPRIDDVDGYPSIDPNLRQLTNAAGDVKFDWANASVTGDNTGDQDLSGKEDVGVASGLVGTHESTYDHSLIGTALQSETDPLSLHTSGDNTTNLDIDLETSGKITGEMAKVQDTEPSSQVGDLWYDPDAPTPTAFDHALCDNLDYASAGHTGFEPAITAGTSAQFLKGDKSLDSSVYLTTGFVSSGDVQTADVAESSLTADSTWRDLDLSTFVPAGTKCVLLAIQHYPSSGGSIQIIKKGDSTSSPQNRIILSEGGNSTADCLISVDANRYVQYRLTSGNTYSGSITVKGWWL
jgi:hypothetical protein